MSEQKVFVFSVTRTTVANVAVMAEDWTEAYELVRSPYHYDVIDEELGTGDEEFAYDAELKLEPESCDFETDKGRTTINTDKLCYVRLLSKEEEENA